MDDSFPWTDEQIARYLANELSAGERAAFEQVACATPRGTEWLEQLQAGWNAAGAVQDDGAAQQFWARMQGTISAGLPTEQLAARADRMQPVAAEGKPVSSRFTTVRGRAEGKGRHMIGSRTVRAFAVAAVAIIAVGASLNLWRHYRADRPAAAQTYATGIGQRDTVHLADGSRVMLAPGTKLTVSSRFGDAHRDVALVGQAYFDVRNTRRAPFIVRTGNIATRVLGTEFDVKRYATDAIARVVVISGKVQAGETNRTGVALTAGMIALLQDSSATVTTSRDITNEVGWTRGVLKFHNTPLPEVLSTLERWYGVRFEMADSSLNRASVSGRLDFRTTAAALSVLKALLNVDMSYAQLGDTTVITLRPSGRVASPRQMTPSISVISKEVGR